MITKAIKFTWNSNLCVDGHLLLFWSFCVSHFDSLLTWVACTLTIYFVNFSFVFIFVTSCSINNIFYCLFCTVVENEMPHWLFTSSLFHVLMHHLLQICFAVGPYVPMYDIQSIFLLCILLLVASADLKHMLCFLPLTTVWVAIQSDLGSLCQCVVEPTLSCWWNKVQLGGIIPWLWFT